MVNIPRVETPQLDFPPLVPSLNWWTRWLSAYIDGASEIEAIKTANLQLSSPRGFGRFAVAQPNNKEPMMLSVALEGGGRALRSFHRLESLILSQHGNWRHTHLGALESLLGRTPFYRHLQPHIEKIYLDLHIQRLSDFNFAIFRVLKAFLLENVTPEAVKAASMRVEIINRGREIIADIDGRDGILPHLAFHGMEILLGILALRIQQSEDFTNFGV